MDSSTGMNSKTDLQRTSALEALYVALVRHQADPHNWRWREVLEAMKEVEKANE